MLQLISPPRLSKEKIGHKHMPMRNNKRSLQCEQGGHHWSQLSGSQVIDRRIQLWYLAHLADSNHNFESAANGEHFFLPFLLSVDQKTQRRGGNPTPSSHNCVGTSFFNRSFASPFPRGTFLKQWSLCYGSGCRAGLKMQLEPMSKGTHSLGCTGAHKWGRHRGDRG